MNGNEIQAFKKIDMDMKATWDRVCVKSIMDGKVGLTMVIDIGCSLTWAPKSENTPFCLEPGQFLSGMRVLEDGQRRLTVEDADIL